MLNDPLCLMDKTVIKQNILNLVRYSKNIIYYVYMDTNRKKENTLICHKLCTTNSHYTCTFICYVCTCMSRAQHAHAHILFMYIYMLCVYVHVARATCTCTHNISMYMHIDCLWYISLLLTNYILVIQSCY